MNTAVKITAFVAVLAASFGAAYGVGTGVGPVAPRAGSAPHGGHEPGAPSRQQRQGGGDAPAGGLQISEGGYTLDLKTPRVEAGRRTDLRFLVRDSKGQEVTSFKREHEKELHLIVTSRDLSVFRHLHPVRAADGTWSTPVDLPEAGDYRIFADFTPDAENAENLTLGADLAASGTYEPAEPAKPSRTAEVDGYTVTLDGRLREGAGE
ncbi:MAG TPA: hypothetical protein VGO89_18220, partial [Streptomyces sp.]|nr:hypothetical protein [Streptomyces sp.]